MAKTKVADARLRKACKLRGGTGWLTNLLRQIRGISLFDGELAPTRVPLFAPFSGRPSLPFPHPWNYKYPLSILDTFYWGADAEAGPGRHNRYLEVPGFAPVYITRDRLVIRAITHNTGNKPGQFDRDEMETEGIKNATGSVSMLRSNGDLWWLQKKLAAAPFGKTKLFKPEQFLNFYGTFRHSAAERLALWRQYRDKHPGDAPVAMEPEIKTSMLEMLTNNFFGCQLTYSELRTRFVPSIERVIDHIVRDTVVNRLGIPLERMPGITAGIRQAKEDQRDFNRLTKLVVDQRQHRTGLWKEFDSDVPDEALHTNIRVFLAGALEATTSWASWAISHMARNPAVQEKVYQEVKDIEEYTPDCLDRCPYLMKVLEETLRLTPALYFLPRRPTVDTWVETDGGRLFIPAGTHILLDVWNCNRHEDFWGVAATGFPALDFVPERWDNPKLKGKDFMHFGFGNGPRVCPGKHLGTLETALVVGAFVKLFRFRAVNKDNPARAGVSTKPADGVMLFLEERKRTTETVAALAV